MKNMFKSKYLTISIAALLPVAAVAADGAEGKGPSAEARKARIERMEACAANPEQCRAERQARMAQHQAERKARFEQRFKQADADGNGAIDRAEAEKALPHLARHFDRIDADKDGQVTFEEIAAARKVYFEQRRGHRGEGAKL